MFATTELSTATLCFFFPSAEAERHRKRRASLSSPHSSDLVTEGTRCNAGGGRQRICTQICYSIVEVS